ncbi:MAG TPA: abortive infection family protein [Candidatus Luteococcus avicola]|nr:abortive infection family protein [Candidatus Luteococcus avicola]
MVTRRVSSDVAAAVAAFFHGGSGPTHAVVTRCLVSAGLNDDYRYDPNGPSGPNKEQRVLSGFTRAERIGDAGKLLERLIGALRHEGLIGSEDGPSEDEQRLRRALKRDGFELTEAGDLRAVIGVDLDTGGRAALEETMGRLRSSTTDPALAIGTAKDLLESVAKFVLEDLGMPVDGKMDFNAVWYIARERLGILPEKVDQSLPGYKQLRKIHQSSWAIAENVNELRNLQGTGHGRTLPTGVSEDLALLVVREACSVAEYMLRLLDKERGLS